MNRVIGILLMLLMMNCVSPLINSDPEPIVCKGQTLVLTTAGLDVAVWKRENKNHDYTIENGRIYVTLSSISPGYLSAWLFTNDPYVLFEQSLNCILCHHFIADIDKFDLGKNSKTFTYKQIKEILATGGYTLTDTFRQYVGLSFDNRGVLTLAGSRSFEPDKFYYSMAFFMAVGRNNGFDDSTSFTFHDGSYQDEPVIIIEVTGRHKNYYDFAQYPPLR